MFGSDRPREAPSRPEGPVRVSVETDGDVARLVIADSSSDDRWISMPQPDAPFIPDWR